MPATMATMLQKITAPTEIVLNSFSEGIGDPPDVGAVHLSSVAVGTAVADGGTGLPDMSGVFITVIVAVASGSGVSEGTAVPLAVLPPGDGVWLNTGVSEGTRSVRSRRAVADGGTAVAEDLKTV